MPYELIAKAGIPTGLLIILAFLIKVFMDDRKKESENYRKDREADQESYQKLVEDIMEQNAEREKSSVERSEKRENMLIEQLDRYNDSLKEISANIKVIPQIQADINYLKEKVK